MPAVQVMGWRLLTRLSSEDCTQVLLDMLFLVDDTLQWAKASGEAQSDDSVKHLDCNGALFEAGDTVTLTKVLNVKGSSLTAKRGTAVRSISLVADNPGQI